MATAPDISKLTYSELKALADEANSLLESKRTHELDVLVDGWAKKAAAQGFTPSEVIAVFQKYLPKGRAKSAGKSKGDFTHVNPKNAAEGYRGKGPHPKWLAAAIAGGKKLEDFAV